MPHTARRPRSWLIFDVSQKMATTFTALLIACLLALCVSACAHKASVATVEPSNTDALSECFAEIVAVKREPWAVRLSSHGYPDAVWQGPITVLVRFRSPTAQAGELRSFGVYHENEITIEGRVLAPGDTIKFYASDGVLQRSIVPEVFSNLRDVSRSTGTTRANKAPEPTPGSVTLRASSLVMETKQWTAEPNPARSVPAPVVAHL